MADPRQPDPTQRFEQSSTRGAGSWWQISAENWGRTFVRIRLPIVAIGALGLVLFFASVTEGAGIFILFVVAWWFGPFLIYLLFITSRAGSIFFGVLLLLVDTFELVWIVDVMESSSTGAIGFLTLPILTYPTVVGAVVVDRALEARAPAGKQPAAIAVIGSIVIGVATIGVLLNMSESVQSGLGIVTSASGDTVAFADSPQDAVEIATKELGFVWPGTSVQDETGPDGTITVERRWLGLLEARALVIPAFGRYEIRSETYSYGPGNTAQLLVASVLGLAAAFAMWWALRGSLVSTQELPV